MRLLAFVVVAAALLSACANSIESRTADGGGVGLSYMAPMRLLTITATRAPPAESAALTRARTALVNAEAELAGATSALQTATQEAQDARALATASSNIASLVTIAVTKEAAQATAQARVDLATTRARAARFTYANLLSANRNQEDVDRALSAYLNALSSLSSVEARRDGLSSTATADERAAAQLAVNVAIAAAARERVAYEQLLTTFGPLRETIEVTMGAAVGDPNTRFVANVNTNWFRSATGRIVVGQNGLLQSANLTVDGQLDEALVGVAQSLVSLSTAGGGSVKILEDVGTRSQRCDRSGNHTDDALPADRQNDPAAIHTRAISAASALAPTVLSIVFDPAVPNEAQRVNRALCGAGFSYRVHVRPIARADQPEDQTADQTDDQTENRTIPTQAGETSRTANFRRMCGLALGHPSAIRRCPGLVYRQSEPWMVELLRFDNETGQQTYVERSFSFSVPNAAPVDVLRYDDAIFVTRRDDVGFVDGSLVSLDFDRPSEAAVAAAIPFRIVRGTTEVLSELVQLRVNLTNQRAALTTAEQTQANAVATGAASSEIAQLESARQLLELRLQVEEARQRLLEAETRAAGGGD